MSSLSVTSIVALSGCGVVLDTATKPVTLLSCFHHMPSTTRVTGLPESRICDLSPDVKMTLWIASTLWTVTQSGSQGKVYWTSTYPNRVDHGAIPKSRRVSLTLMATVPEGSSFTSGSVRALPLLRYNVGLAVIA